MTREKDLPRKRHEGSKEAASSIAGRWPHIPK